MTLRFATLTTLRTTRSLGLWRAVRTATSLLTLATASASAAEARVGDYAYRGSAGGAQSITANGDASWDVTSVEIVVRPLGGVGSAGIVLHQQNASNHYLFLLSTNSNALMIYKNVGGSFTLLASTPFTVPIGEEHVLRAEDAGGGTLNLYWDGLLQVTTTDTTFSTGLMGLRVWNMAVEFDDVAVEADGGGVLLFDDFEDGNADGWIPGGGWNVMPSASGNPMPAPVFDTAFEGGNGELTLVDLPNWSLRVRPELIGSSPYRAWFYFKLSNLSSERPVSLVFENVNFFTRPYYSYDEVNWQPFPANGSGQLITFDEDTVWIAHSIPYVTSHKERLIADAKGTFARTSLLSTSEGGRPVDLIRITAPGSTARRAGVWVVARQHAWEASGSWMADGLVRWLLSGTPEAQRLLFKADVFVVPIMDIDNVVLGGSGKDQQPLDINRDWRSEPSWNAVDDAISALNAFAEVRSYDLFIDSHCPGGSSTFLGVQPQSMVPVPYWQDFSTFRELFASEGSSAAAPYTGAFSEWGPSYHPLWYQMSFWHQYENHPELRLSLTLETSVSTAQGYRELSAALGRAIERFLPGAPSGGKLWKRPSPTVDSK